MIRSDFFHQLTDMTQELTDDQLDELQQEFQRIKNGGAYPRSSAK
jgi:hypothetical protein